MSVEYERALGEHDGIKKARLVEEQIGYEELAVKENFSEDEITYEL